MSFQEVLAELPSMTVEQRQLLMRRALELDDSAMSPAEEQLIEERREEYRRDPSSALSLDEMGKRLRARLVRVLASSF